MEKRYDTAGTPCHKCGGSIFNDVLFKGSRWLSALHCIQCGTYIHSFKIRVKLKPREIIMTKKKNDKKSKGKVAIAMLLLALCFAVPALAEENITGTWADADGDIVQYSGLNVSGDTLYLPSSGSFAVGIGS